MKENPNYYAIIPANVRYADIPAQAKLLYGEITALCNKEGFCWATNKYFASLYNVSEFTVSRWISKLRDKKLLAVDITKSQKGQEVLRKLSIPIDEKSKGGIDENSKGINTSINNTKNIVENKFSTPVSDKKKEPMNSYQFYEWTKKSNQEHIRLIGEWADTVKPLLATRGQWEEYIRRNLRPAKSLTQFSVQQIEKAYTEICSEKNKLRYSPAMETLLKKLTK